MDMKELSRVIDQVVREKGIDREVLIDALEQALVTAARKKLGNRNLEAQFDEESAKINIYEYMTVVEEVTDSYTEISLEEARTAISATTSASPSSRGTGAASRPRWPAR
jgi:N utilization substance protein A